MGRAFVVLYAINNHARTCSPADLDGKLLPSRDRITQSWLEQQRRAQHQRGRSDVGDAEVVDNRADVATCSSHAQLHPLGVRMKSQERSVDLHPTIVITSLGAK